jgi:outer membrane protein assembly factor BamA
VILLACWRIPLIHWWRQVTEARTSQGVQGILKKYQSQNRLMARVELQKPAPERRVQPHLSINAGPAVKVEAIETKVSKRVLKRYVPIFEERVVDNDLLVQGKRNLQDYLQSQGYYDSDVEFRVVPPRDDLETIQYVISKGQRFKLVHVTITGNHYFDAETIQERMFIQPAALSLRRGRYSEAFRRSDEETISDLYKSNGFRDVKVTTTVNREYRAERPARYR